MKLKMKQYYLKNLTVALSLCWILVSPLSGFSQQKIYSNIKTGDISGAVRIESDTVDCMISPTSFGRKAEINSQKTDSTSLEKEHHSIWYRYFCMDDCVLSFTLSPLKAGDDYDFMMFEIQKGKKDTLFVIRCNKARVDEKIGGITGLKKSAGNRFVGEGPGNSFSNSIKLSKGKTYYLLVDNVYDNGGGHRIIFSKSDCNSKISLVEKGYNLSVFIRNKETKKPMESKVILIKTDYPNSPDTVLNTIGFHFFAPLDSGKYYKIVAMAENFLTYKTDFKVGRYDSIKELDINLQEVAVGKKIVLENIYFSGGSAVMLRKSMNSLRDLLQTLTDNPTLEIEIQGHVNQPVNSPKDKKESYYQSLSEERAKAVYDYLIKRKIDPARLTYKGFGYANMIYPYASTPEEEEANRRVEILIIKR